MKFNPFAVWSILAATVCLSLTAYAFRAPDRPALPNLDSRQKPGAPERKPLPAQAAAAQALRSTLPGARVDFDRVTGTPKFATGGSSFLTGQNGVGKAVGASAAALFAGDRHAPTKAFLHAQRDLFGFGPESLDKALLKRDSVTERNGVRTAIWQQHVANIPVFEATLVSHTTKRGELISIASGFVPDPNAAVKLGHGNSSQPKKSAAEALALAAQNLGEPTQAGEVQIETPPAAQDATKRQELHAAGLNGKATANLAWVPLNASTLHLAWEIICTSHTRGEMFRVLIDAENGDVLLRHCLTEYLTDVTYRVYTNDSPSPFSPGWSTPNSTQPPLVSRQLVTLSALNPNASPGGWIPDGANQTVGNNVDAHTDTNADDSPDLPRPQGSPARVFDFPMGLATQEPSGYRDAAVVQLFYWNNWMHDQLYALGFTEEAGNFQNDNFGRGGFGGDPVQADAQDGGGTDNANFSCPPDGSVPRMQMYVFGRPTPKRDGDLDAEIVLHEYTHGLSARHVNGGGGLSALQSRGMGEGWSDFYALSLLSQSSDNVDGCYAAGAYASYMIGGSSDTLNYYFGIRRYPYSTDLSKNPLTFNDIDPTQADYCSSGAPFHSAMFGSCRTSNADEVHAQGEVWCVTLWEARARLIKKHGWAAGNQLSLQLVTDGMLFSPANPNFVQARDGILQADMVDSNGENLDELWSAFAKRGLGFSATSPSSTTTYGVHESFDMPDDLRISPLVGMVSSGPVGGPFNVTSQTFTLTNFGSNGLAWVCSKADPWLNVSASSGSLQASGAAIALTVRIDPVANLLPAGLYPTRLFFTNLVSGAAQARDFLLRIGQPDTFTELFEAQDNDLAYSTLTFTPDGSASFYSCCRQDAASFPTDPTGGTPVSLSDDSFVRVTLTGASVSLYGRATNSFFIGSNGYLTLESGDNNWAESAEAHFDRPRISALFHDQLPVVTTVISWKQLSDRVAVTYQGLSDIDQTGLNDFQIEWFFNGRIRITYLGTTNGQNLVGLSAGTGVPAGFAETDLSQAGSCTRLEMTLPDATTEGAGVLPGTGLVSLPVRSGADTVVTLTSSDTSVLRVPTSVTVPAGQSSASFDLEVLDDAVADGTRVASVTVSAPQFGSTSRSMRIYDNEIAAFSLRLPADVVEGQQPAEGLLTLHSPAAMTLFIELSSSDSSKLTVPPGVIIPRAESAVVFPITVLDNLTANPQTDVVITAHVQSWPDAAQAITVLDSPSPVTRTSNPALIVIQDNGPASVYPSQISVSGVPGVISRITVTVSNVFHTFPGDVGMMLVGPNGTNLVLMANAGGDPDLNGVTLTFDDAAVNRIPSAGPVPSGTYRPTSLSPGTWPAPAPAASAFSELGIFQGTSPNGTWRLFVYDDSAVDTGRISDGWSLFLQTALPPAPTPMLLAPTVSGQSIRLTFDTALAHTYFVEYADQGPAGPWLPLKAVTGTGGAASVTDSSPAAQRFYRLRVQ